jgi:hypothetical protein
MEGVTAWVRAVRSKSDTGSESFFRDTLLNKEINSRPEAGTSALPPIEQFLRNPVSEPTIRELAGRSAE